jgi:hypothetical protein
MRNVSWRRVGGRSVERMVFEDGGIAIVGSSALDAIDGKISL